MNPIPCPLCHGPESRAFFSDRDRDYWRCGNCRLVFLHPEQRLDPVREKAEYDRHRNHPGDPGYRRFLDRLFEPLVERLQHPAGGLDFGSGPGPTLSVMFEEAGFPMALYDPFYAPDTEPLNRRHDFITCTEVVEHLYKPGDELARLIAMLRPGGWLGIMTKQVIDRAAFARWHYKNDPTHVCFFCRDSFIWLAQQHRLKIEFFGQDVVLMQTEDAPDRIESDAGSGFTERWN